MKKNISVMLCVILFLSAVGCAQEKPVQDPVTFYYCRYNLDYGNAADGVIQEEIRDAEGQSSDYFYVLSLYLKGPENTDLYRPFPTTTDLVKVSVKEGTVFVELSHSFSSLSPLALTLSCACLTLTACELTGAAQCTIFVDNVLLNGNPSITMSPGDILLLDDSSIVIAPE